MMCYIPFLNWYDNFDIVKRRTSCFDFFVAFEKSQGIHNLLLSCDLTPLGFLEQAILVWTTQRQGRHLARMAPVQGLSSVWLYLQSLTRLCRCSENGALCISSVDGALICWLWSYSQAQTDLHGDLGVTASVFYQVTGPPAISPSTWHVDFSSVFY